MQATITETEKLSVLIPKRMNAATTRNMLAKYSKGEILVFLDDDVVPKEDTIFELINDMKADAVSGRYTDYTPHQGFFTQLQNLIVVLRFSKERKVSFINSALFAIKREAFERVGGFDESMDYYEDMDLGFRVKDCYINPKAQGTHLKKFSHFGLLKDYYKKTYTAGKYFKRNPDINMNLPNPTDLLVFLYKKKGLWFTIRAVFVLFEIAVVSTIGFKYGSK